MGVTLLAIHTNLHVCLYDYIDTQAYATADSSRLTVDATFGDTKIALPTLTKAK